MTQPQPALVELPPDTVTRYVEALGISPGPEFLMSLAIERENPMELIDVFCATIVQSLRESRA